MIVHHSHAADPAESGGIWFPGAVSIGSSATSADFDPETIARARTVFEQGRAIGLPDALAPPLLDSVLSLCRQGPFIVDQVGRIGWRTIEERDLAGLTLRFALGRAAFLRWIEAVTGCGPISLVTGVVAEMAAGTDQGLDWHDDCNEPGRRLGLTVHLSDGPVDGGLFEMRETEGESIVVREPPQAAGAIMLFRIDPALRHRVTPVIDGRPRRVFAGWIMV